MSKKIVCRCKDDCDCACIARELAANRSEHDEWVKELLADDNYQRARDLK